MTPQGGIPIGEPQLSDNQRVAKAIGWQWHPERGEKRTIDDVPAFTHDPAASALLKAYIKARSWSYQTGWDKTRGAWAEVSSDGDWRTPYSGDTEEIALVVAFLAAYDAQEQESRS